MDDPGVVSFELLDQLLCCHIPHEDVLSHPSDGSVLPLQNAGKVHSESSEQFELKEKKFKEGYWAASIGTEVKWCYCQAKLLESRAGMDLQLSPWAGESVTALSSWRMWTVWMINCLRCAGYHSDTALQEPLMCESQVRVPVGEEGQNSANDCNLKDHRFHAKTLAFPSLITVTYVSES